MVHVEGKPTREVPNQHPEDAKRVGVATVTTETIQYNAALEGGLVPQGRTNKEDLKERERNEGKRVIQHKYVPVPFRALQSQNKERRGGSSAEQNQPDSIIKQK